MSGGGVEGWEVRANVGSIPTECGDTCERAKVQRPPTRSWRQGPFQKKGASMLNVYFQ